MEELLEARNKMTFGQLVSHMKEQWILKPEVGQFIDFFLQERNTFIHGLTALEGYNPRYKQQRVKLKHRVLQFMEMALLARRIFRAANFASNDFASSWLKEHKDVDIKLPHDPNIQEEIDFFLELLGDQREELQL
jgi:hypothetical protein